MHGRSRPAGCRSGATAQPTREEERVHGSGFHKSVRGRWPGARGGQPSRGRRAPPGCGDGVAAPGGGPCPGVRGTRARTRTGRALPPRHAGFGGPHGFRFRFGHREGVPPCHVLPCRLRGVDSAARTYGRRHRRGLPRPDGPPRCPPVPGRRMVRGRAARPGHRGGGLSASVGRAVDRLLRTARRRRS